MKGIREGCSKNLYPIFFATLIWFVVWYCIKLIAFSLILTTNQASCLEDIFFLQYLKVESIWRKVTQLLSSKNVIKLKALNVRATNFRFNKQITLSPYAIYKWVCPSHPLTLILFFLSTLYLQANLIFIVAY